MFVNNKFDQTCVFKLYWAMKCELCSNMEDLIFALNRESPSYNSVLAQMRLRELVR